MENNRIYLLIVPVVIAMVFIWLYMSSLDNNKSLMRLNKSLDDEITSYKSAQSNMLVKISKLTSMSEDNKEEIKRLLSEIEIHNFEFNSKVKWLDKSGEEEFGIVCDDFFSDNKHFVVVRGVKNGKVSGRYFTISAEKIVSE
jgi:hypothetical protein